MTKTDASPLSLAQLFEAPDDHLGCFGWVCGYSADAAFMNDAIERFTRRTEDQRARDGDATLALILDRGNPQVSPVDVPGVLHLPLRGAPPFRLLHAKVALLGFREVRRPHGWRLRLVVSTGNWTRQTLKESLDLGWRVEVTSADLEAAPDNTVAAAAADIGGAWDMLSWLREQVDEGLLGASRTSHAAADEVRSWIRTVAEAARGRPRFLDNREASFLKQLPDRVSRGARNYLAMGSGFYEGSAAADAVPSVLEKIVTALQAEGRLTRHPEIDLVVDPASCQAVAEAMPAIEERGWTVRKPGNASFGNIERKLHAKFVFGASHRENSSYCNGAWLYLGSGNLTGPGFANAMSPSAGNLEAGVVFEPERLLWFEERGRPERIVTRVLPLDFEDGSLLRPAEVAAGEEMPERPPAYLAPPVPFLRWEDGDDGGRLMPPDAPTAECRVVGPDGAPCDALEDVWLWPHARPREVEMRWAEAGVARSATVPVVDGQGRIAASPLPVIGLEEAWLQLAEFPMPPEEDVDETREPTAMVGAATMSSAPVRAAVQDYPVRSMMDLVERIAARQTVLTPADWTAWLTRLEQSLIQAADSPATDTFRALGLDPLSPLRAAPFRPAFAEDATTPEGAAYEAALDRIEAAWRVEGLERVEVAE